MSWFIFACIIFFFLVIDLGFLHRRAHKISTLEAVLTSLAWICLSLCFGIWVYWAKGPENGLLFFTGYLIELALSVDNLFVFLLIFSYFHIPEEYRHKVLFWGILGAIVLRGIFIALGVVLIERFEWLLYIFGTFLIYSAYKLAKEKDKEIHPEQNPLILWLKKYIPVTHHCTTPDFFVRIQGILYATPLFLALISAETTDVIFALDSIPAIFGITKDPFIIYTSNIFAILGLRSLYFTLANLMNLFHHLHYGLAAILFLVGVKMLLKDVFHLPIFWALGLIALILFTSIIASLIWPKKIKDTPEDSA